MAKVKGSSVAAIILGSIITVPLLIFGFLTFQSVLTRASNQVPTDVRAVQATDSSVTIVWTTGEETTGIIEYGTNPAQLIKFAPEVEPTTDHRVAITLLEPATTYYYILRIGDELYDNDGIPFQFRTLGEGDTETDPNIPASPGAQGNQPDQDADPLTPFPTTANTLPVTTPANAVCPATADCEQIRSLFGNGCTTTDYLKCIRGQQ